jgi:hypothetical protein
MDFIYANVPDNVCNSCRKGGNLKIDIFKQKLRLLYE